MNNESTPFRTSAHELRSTFGTRVQKISIDAGFSCPNRDGRVGTAGCSYCRVDSFVPSYCGGARSVREQVEAGIAFFAHKYKDQKYLAYFQAYTSSDADSRTLRAMWEEALSVEGVCGLVVATRPDSLAAPVIELLAEFSARTWVLVELGVESLSDTTLARVRRGHTGHDSIRCVRSLFKAGIRCGAHLIFGLPGESSKELLVQREAINELPVSWLKLHHLQVLQGTAMARDFELHSQDFWMPEADEYLEFLIDYLGGVRPDFVFDRFLNESPQDLVIAPRWEGVKNWDFARTLSARMDERGLRQGCNFVGKHDGV